MTAPEARSTAHALDEVGVARVDQEPAIVPDGDRQA
jgi:hypothetical protein